MSDLRKAAEMALEFVEFVWRDVSLNEYAEEKRSHIEKILEDALAQPEQEPVAYRFQSPATEEWLLGLEPPAGSRWEIERLYTHPPQRKPLTDDEINKVCAAPHLTVSDFVRAIEKAHGIGGEE